MAVFSRAIFQVAERVTVGNLMKTVACLTRLKLSKVTRLKLKPPSQVA